MVLRQVSPLRLGNWPVFLLLVGLLSLLAVGVSADESSQFTNEAGQPIMAVDFESSGIDTPVWKEGHRWDTPGQIPAVPGRIRQGPTTTRPARMAHRPRTKMVTRWISRALFLGLLWTMIVHVLLGLIVFVDLRSLRRNLSRLWVLVVLLAGLPGMALYIAWKWVERDPGGQASARE